MVRQGETEAAYEKQAATLRLEAKDDALLLDAVEDFLRKREQDVPTALLVDGIVGIDVQPEAEITRRVNNESFWTSFAMKFPRSTGYGKLSRVGLSRNGKLAVIAHSMLAGPLMGFGKYSVFEKAGGKWIASSRKIKGGWIS